MSQIVNRNLEILQKLNIIDDFMFFKMCEDKEVCEEIISTILGRKIQVAETMYSMPSETAGQDP